MNMYDVGGAVNHLHIGMNNYAVGRRFFWQSCGIEFTYCVNFVIFCTALWSVMYCDGFNVNMSVITHTL